MNRITEDVSRVRMYLGPAIMYVINMIFLFSLVISKMFYVSSTLTLYVLIPLPILVITVFYVSNKINKNSLLDASRKNKKIINQNNQLDEKRISILNDLKKEKFNPKSFL